MPRLARSPCPCETSGDRRETPLAADARFGDRRHHCAMTDAPTPSAELTPDPDLYDSPRAELARARGLSAPYISGGTDPDPGPALQVDRYYGRLLVFMVVTIILAGFVLGIVIAVAELAL